MYDMRYVHKGSLVRARSDQIRLICPSLGLQYGSSALPKA